MEKPHYVLKANEGVLVPKNEDSPLSKLKLPIWIIVGTILLGSLIFQDNLFSELSWSSRILLIALAIGVSFAGGNKRVASPFEIQFYDYYLIVYRDKYYYSKRVTRKELYKFLFKDITKCQYRRVTKRINIFGDVEAIWYNYNKDGSLPEKPTYHRMVKNGICYFYTSEAPEVDFVEEIENHSPIKVVIDDN
ncbi:hypothetical protein DRW41_05540 [Neobacillus piezotolerans]|uniref:Uncharacterized protein n=1 Tax=Neobacillus piezotolerans TaxID=2259171 RepID=A0A3D8GS80_9BACI|nr:hypothetical protein [Neobacillus piezotolerans]RDU37315.1 hypothetical protein DRW41_05540 [Neobacillus piezotolerans]